MKKRFNFFQILGISLLAVSLGLLLYSRIQAGRAANSCESVIAQMESLLPERTVGVPEDFTEMGMPVLQLGKQDFCGLVEVPAFGVKLPIYNNWETGKLTFFPCRFWGTVYDGSLVLGGADQDGQFDFCDQIQNGSYVTVTDMTGSEFTYTVTRIDRSKNADAGTLLKEGFDLVLFARDSYSLEYLIVRCNMA